jgi:hypothetical protein
MGTRRLGWGRPGPGGGGGTPALPDGAVLDLRFEAAYSYQSRTSNTTPAGVGDPLRRVVASTGQVFAVAADDDAGTLRADGAELQVYDNSTRPNPELTTDTPVEFTGEFTAFFVGTLVSDKLWATDLIYQSRRANGQLGPGEDPAYASDLMFVKTASGVPQIINQPVGPLWYVPEGEAFVSLRRDSSNNLYMSGTNAMYSDGSERKEAYIGVYSGTLTLSKIGKAFITPGADPADWYSAVNSSTDLRYRRVHACDSSLSASDYDDVLTVLNSETGVSTDRREPIVPAVPSYTLPGSPPARFSYPVFRPSQLIWRGGVKLPSIDIGGNFNWLWQGGFAVDRSDGGALKFLMNHHWSRMIRISMGSASFSTNPDPTTWDTLASTYDDYGTFEFGETNVDRLSGVLRHSNGGLFATAFNNYGSPSSHYVSRKSADAATQYGPFACGGAFDVHSQNSGGLIEIPQDFADYIDDTVGSTKTLVTGTIGYRSGDRSGGGQVWSALDATDTTVGDTTLAAVVMCRHADYNSSTGDPDFIPVPDDRERRDPDYVPGTLWDAPFPPGSNAYWGSVAAFGGSEYIDSPNGHGFVFPTAVGFGRQVYNFQSGNFTGAEKLLWYVQDAGALAAVARGVLTTVQPRATWHAPPAWPANLLPNSGPGPWSIRRDTQAGAGVGGLERVYVLWGGVFPEVSPPGLYHSAICAYDVGPQS